MTEFKNDTGSQAQDRPQSQKFDVSALNLKCETCSVTITELPFQPTKKEDGSYGKLYCRECNAKRPRRRFGGGFGNRGFDR
jgi:hypothetical protein